MASRIPAERTAGPRRDDAKDLRRSPPAATPDVGRAVDPRTSVLDRLVRDPNRDWDTAANRTPTPSWVPSRGHPLPTEVRGPMEDRFGTNFGDVRVHVDPEAAAIAADHQADALTVGSDVLFGAGRWSPQQPSGRALLAHELTHVVQQGRGSGGGDPEAEASQAARSVARGDDVMVTGGVPAGSVQRQPATDGGSVSIPESTGLGLEETTAPIATTSPQRQLNQALDRELILIAKARILSTWIDARTQATFEDMISDSALVGQLDLSKDTAVAGRLRPFGATTKPGTLPAPPRRRAQLFPTDDTLQELLLPPKDVHDLWPILDLLSHYGVIRFVPRPDDPFGPPLVASIGTGKAAAQQRKTFGTTTQKVETVARTFKRQVALQPTMHHSIDSDTLPRGAAQGLQVANPVAALMRRVEARNDTFRAGTYPKHWWNDFSVDVFLGGLNTAGFYRRSVVRQFLADLDAASQESGPPGKFAWKVIYNDTGLATEMNERYGAGRILTGVPGHGPGSGIHLHVDLRPLTVQLDATTGFFLDGDRVVLTPPPARTSLPLLPPLPVLP